MLREVKCAQRQTRIIPVSVDGTGTASLLEGGRDCVLTDNGTGDYTLTFNRAFLREPIVVCNTRTQNAYQQVNTRSKTSVQILSKNLDDDTALDADFDVLITGFDAADAV